MIDNVFINKSAQIERCLKRIKEEYQQDFEENYTRQDAVILNIQRACQACIDMGSHYIRKHKLGIPQYSGDIFEILAKDKIISYQLKARMIAMVGFRNVAIHDYSILNLKIVKSIVENHLNDFTLFIKQLKNN